MIDNFLMTLVFSFYRELRNQGVLEDRIQDLRPVRFSLRLHVPLFECRVLRCIQRLSQEFPNSYRQVPTAQHSAGLWP